MAKLASKDTKEILLDSEISSKKLDKSRFVSSWKGKIIILNPEKSEIAKKLKITKKGEYAIKL